MTVIDWTGKGGKQTALIRVQKNELVVAERKIDEQIARAENGVRTGRRIIGGSIGLLVASLAGFVLVPHIAIAAVVVGSLSGFGGVIKADINEARIAKEVRRRQKVLSERQNVEQTRLQRLDNAAAAALETERCAGTLALGREMRIDFEDAPPKILRIEEMGSVFGPDSEGRQIRLRIVASLYEAAVGADDSLRPTGNGILMVTRNFEPMSETMPPPGLCVQAPDPTPSPPPQSGPEKKLPPCTPV
jgi:hypothetical protein